MARGKSCTHDAEDRLSKMPDDILLAVLERLDIRDAARTGTLSRRLRQIIPSMLNKLVINVTSFEPTSKGNRSNITFDDLAQANATMAEATKSILATRKASTSYPCNSIWELRSPSPLSKLQTVAGTMGTQRVGSAEFAILTKKGRANCTEDDVLLNGRQLMLLVDSCPNAFGGLTCLKLENVRLEEPDFPKILGTCKRLEFLRLNNCDMGMLSLLEVEHPQLSKLEMYHCSFVRVHLKWLPRLAKLAFSTWVTQQDPFSFGYVPLLQSVSLTNIGLSWHKMLKLSEVLGNATISTLYLYCKSEKDLGSARRSKTVVACFP